MSRLSRPITDENLAATRIEEGYPVVVVSWKGASDLKVRSLKRLNRAAYDDHIAELQIDGRSVWVNIEDLKRALRYV